MSSSSSLTAQAAIINRYRSKLLDYFCKYDLGKMTQNELESAMKDMNIFPTQTYKSYIRRKCGNLKFTEFISALSLSDDKLINDMMNIPNDTIPVDFKNENKNKQETLLESPHRSRAIGQYNSDIYIYNQKKDFLKWKSPQEIHKNDRYIDNKNTFVSTENNKTNTETINKCLSIKELCKLYCRGSISINEFEQRIKKEVIELNVQQQRMINLCKIDPNVSLSQLLLCFQEPKYQSIGNFDAEQAINAQREPLIFIDHPHDIITWKSDDQDTTFKNMTKRKTFEKRRKSDILTWKQISNQEFNEKVIRKKPPIRGSDSFHSHICFDQGLVPNESNMENTLSCVKKVNTQIDHLKSTKDLLKWNKNKPQNGIIPNKDYKLSFIKYRHDDRVPYTD